MSVQNLMGLHTHFHSLNMNGEEIKNIWSHKQPDISYAYNGNYYVGMPSIKYYYVEMKEQFDRLNLEKVARVYNGVQVKPGNYGIGTVIAHPVSSPIVEIAGDGQTAKGIWDSAGQVTELDNEGKPRTQLMWEKYACDFIREDEGWKIWHLHVYSDYSSPLGEKPANEAESRPALKMPQPDISVPGLYERYHMMRLPKEEPKPPEPYETFSHAFSYGPPETRI